MLFSLISLLPLLTAFSDWANPETISVLIVSGKLIVVAIISMILKFKGKTWKEMCLFILDIIKGKEEQENIKNISENAQKVVETITTIKKKKIEEKIDNSSSSEIKK